MTGDDFYRSIPLTEEEIEAALLEGKKKKFFKQKADLKEKEDGMHQLREPENRKQRPDVVRYLQQAAPKDNTSKAIGASTADQKEIGYNDAHDGDLPAKGGKVSNG